MHNVNLHFDFVCPEWNVVNNAEAAVRVKIENGIVFFKPRWGPVTELDRSDERRNLDLITIHRVRMGFEFTASLGRGHPLTTRLLAVLERMGWTRQKPYFELQTAQRGWLAITLPAIHAPPQVLFTEHLITSEAVARVLGIKYVRMRRIEAKSVSAERILVNASA